MQLSAQPWKIHCRHDPQLCVLPENPPICQHCNQSCLAIKNRSITYGGHAEHAFVYCFAKKGYFAPLGMELRVWRLPTESLLLEIRGTTTSSPMSLPNNSLEAIITVLQTFPFPPKIAPGACFRRTLSDQFEKMEGQKDGIAKLPDPCLMIVFDSGQRPNFDENDCAELKNSKKWDICQLDLNSTFEPDEIFIQAEETELHSEWKTCKSEGKAT